MRNTLGLIVFFIGIGLWLLSGIEGIILNSACVSTNTCSLISDVRIINKLSAIEGSIWVMGGFYLLYGSSGTKKTDG